MPIDDDRISREICLIREDGKEFYPVKMKRQSTGVIAFRVSNSGNTLEDSEEIKDEQEMVQKVLVENYAVRCVSADGTEQGLYKATGRSIVGIKRRTK